MSKYVLECSACKSQQLTYFADTGDFVCNECGACTTETEAGHWLLEDNDYFGYESEETKDMKDDMTKLLTQLELNLATVLQPEGRCYSMRHTPILPITCCSGQVVIKHDEGESELITLYDPDFEGSVTLESSLEALYLTFQSDPTHFTPRTIILLYLWITERALHNVDELLDALQHALTQKTQSPRAVWSLYKFIRHQAYYKHCTLDEQSTLIAEAILLKIRDYYQINEEE